MSFSNKIMDRMFKKVDDVVIDMTTSTIGIKSNGSIFTMSVDEEGDHCLSENMFGEMSFEIPAIATPKKLSDLSEGDLVLNAAGEVFGWVVKIMPKSLKILKPTGQCSSVIPAKANLMGQGQTIMAVSSVINPAEGGMNPMMMMALAGDDMDPMMMMAMGGMGGGATPAMNPMMMAMMMNKGEGGMDKDMLMKMMMLQGMQGAAQPGAAAPAMDPMMMALLMGKN